MGKKLFLFMAFLGTAVLTAGFISLGRTGSDYMKYSSIVRKSVESENVNADMYFDVKLDGMTTMSGNAEQLVHRNGKQIDKMYQIVLLNYKNGERIYESLYDDGKYKLRTDNGYEESELGSRFINILSDMSGRDWNLLTSYLVGNMKNQFVFNGDTTYIHLEGYQISSLNKLILCGAVYSGYFPEKYIADELKRLPKMRNIELRTVDYKSKVANDRIKNIDMRVDIAFEDEQSRKRQAEVNLSGDFDYSKRDIPNLQ